MSVHVDAVIDFILHDAVQDMGTQYDYPVMSIWRQRVSNDDSTTPTPQQLQDRRQSHLIEMFWNEGPVETTYQMQSQGVYIRTSIEVQILCQSPQAIGRITSDFEDSLLALRKDELPPAHHNVSGTIIDHVRMALYTKRRTDENLAEYYYGAFTLGNTEENRQVFPGIPDDDRPIHLISKVVVTGKSISADASTRGWASTVRADLEIALIGFGTEDDLDG